MLWLFPETAGPSRGSFLERDVARALDSLGGALLDEPVLTIMTSEVRAVSPDDEVEALAVIMTEHRMRHVPVLQGEALVGIVSIGDVVKSRIEELEQDREALFRYIEAR